MICFFSLLVLQLIYMLVLMIRLIFRNIINSQKNSLFFLNFSAFIFLVFFFFPLNVFSQPYPRENAVVKAVRKISPAVVNISSEYEVTKRTPSFSRRGPDSFFDFFFKDFFDPGYERKFKRTSLGSGVIIDGQKGYILTNSHVIKSSGTITVILNDEREFQAFVKGSDPDSDLAVLKIETQQTLPSVSMGNSEDLMIGETVIAIGNPFGFSHTVTTGVVSAINRSIRTDDAVYHNFIQTDSSINPGNSGGPLLNINGELIGINTAIYSKAQGIGFAIPINTAKRIVSDLIQHGEVIPVWTGIIVQELDLRLMTYMELSENTSGVLVRDIEKSSPAQKADILPEDIIISIGNRPISSLSSFRSALRDFASGEKINMVLLRDGKQHETSLIASLFPVEKAMDLSEKLLGIRVENLSLTNRLLYKFRSDAGVMVSEILADSYLYEIGVRTGDVILKLDENIIANVDDYKKIIIKYRLKASVVILLQREENSYYITVRL
jgi:Do/DeqQ family serine protease